MLKPVSLVMVQRILFTTLSLSILYLFDFIFPGIVLIDKLHDFEEETCFPINGYHGNRKKAIFRLS